MSFILKVSSLALALFLVIAVRAEAEAPEATAGTAPSGEHATAATEHGDPATAAGTPAAATPRLARYKKDSQECITDPVVIEDLKSRREELEARERDLVAKESELVAKSRALDEEIKRMEEIRDQVAKMEEAQSRNNEEKVAKVVETLEAMSPKNAAALFAQLDDGVAIASMMRMSSAKLSKVMNQLDATRASKLTELLAGVSRVKKSNPKGGENKL